MNRKLAAALILGAAVTLTGCGEKVDVAPAEVGKIMTQNGYKEGTIPTSTFRLPMCLTYCDKLVTIDVSDHAFKESMKLFMPKDKLNMTFDIRATLAIDSDEFETIFNRVTPRPNAKNSHELYVPVQTVYDTYASNIIRAEAREFLAQFTIAEIASSRDTINVELAGRLSDVIREKTPFNVRFLGLADVQYPQVIIEAQENAAERREQIEQENAQLLISEAQLKRKLQEQTMQRKIDVEKAEAEAEVNKILGDSMTAEYRMYRSFQVLEDMAESDNKVFMPVDMLSTVGGQLQLK